MIKTTEKNSIILIPIIVLIFTSIISCVYNRLTKEEIIKLGEEGAAAKEAVPRLIKILNLYKLDLNKETKVLDLHTLDLNKEAAIALGRIGPASFDAVPRLIRVLDHCIYIINNSDIDPTVNIINLCKEVIITLGKIGPAAKDAVAVLIQTLDIEAKNYNQEIIEVLKNEVIHSLGKIGKTAKDAVPRLTIFIDSYEYPNLIDDAIVALGKIDVLSLIHALCDYDDRLHISKEIAGVLSRMRPAMYESAPFLINILNNRCEGYKEKYKELCENSIKALENIVITSTIDIDMETDILNTLVKVSNYSRVYEVEKAAQEALQMINITKKKAKINISEAIEKESRNLIKNEKSVDVTKNNLYNISGNYYALIIGINNYKHLLNLTTAVNDSKAVAKILKRYGFKTTLLIGKVTRTSIMKELNKFRQKLIPDDKLLIYYAGHGEFNKHTEKAYWLPFDAENNDTTNWIIADTITSSIKSIPAKHVLIVSDSCYSGTITRRKVVVDFSFNTSRLYYMNKMLTKKARVLIASGGNEPVLDDNGSGHSVFAAAFIKALKNKNEHFFTAQELFVNHIKEIVAGKAMQIPEYKLIRDSGHEGGDFIFIRKNEKIE